jgi:hypothetical protein
MDGGNVALDLLDLSAPLARGDALALEGVLGAFETVLRASASTAPSPDVGPVPSAGQSHSFADRIRARRAKGAAEAIETMFRTAVAYRIGAAEYNGVLHQRHPELGPAVAAAALETGVTESMALGTALDLSVKEPRLAPLRAKVAQAASDPDLIARRHELHEIARRFEDRAMILARWMQGLDAARAYATPRQVTLALTSLKTVVDDGILARASGLPALGAETPSIKPNTALGRFTDAAGGLGAQLKTVMDQIKQEPEAEPSPSAPRPRIALA